MMRTCNNASSDRAMQSCTAAFSCSGHIDISICGIVRSVVISAFSIIGIIILKGLILLGNYKKDHWVSA